ncbi:MULTISPECIES: helix-turn-helix transcriptional regulator [unclassified Streptomyces]|uniref:helix-turn-helix transcriptional regulator n=1 Tax=unclassified Streptomyces TaxID=2593676 RepID=UPI00380861F1
MERELPPFIGRSAELGALQESLSVAVDGHASVVLLTGEAGIGKSSLLDEVVAAAGERGITVGRARGAPLEREFAFGVARQLFGGLLAEIDDPQREALVDAAGLPAAAVLRDRGFDALPSAQASFTTHHALYRLLGSLADQTPLLLAVDDAHLADAPSLRFLSYAVHRFAALPIVLVLCTTEGEQPHAEEPLQDLTAAARPIPLAALEPAEVGHLVRWAVGDSADEDLALACCEVTGGNPFLLAELLRTLEQRGDHRAQITAQQVRGLGSPVVAERLRSRFRSCPGAAALAHAVAILGDRAEFGLASSLAGLDLGTAAHALDTLAGMKVLQNTYPLAFIHSFVRNAVLESAPAGARIATHAKAAQLLREAQAPAEQIAAHLLHAGSVVLPWAVDALRRAAQLAEARGAPDAAATYLQHALHQPLAAQQHAAVLCELGSAELAFNPTTGIARLRSALDGAADAHEAARAALSLVPALSMVSAHEEAVAVADAVLAGLDPDDRDLTWALGSMAMASQFLRMETVADAHTRIERLATGVPDRPDLQRSRLAFLAAVKGWHGESREEVVQFTRQALAGADALFFRPPGYHSLSALARTDDSGAIEECYAVGDRIARECGSPRAGAVMAVAHGLQSFASGNLAEAAGRFSDALRTFEACGTALETDTDAMPCVAWLVDVLVAAGRVDEAGELLSRCGLLTSRLPELLHHNFVLCARGGLRIAEGDLHGAIEDLEECGRRAAVWQLCNPAALPWRSRAAAAYTALGRHERARELAEDELRDARRWGTPRAIGVALHALGTAVGGDEGAELLAEAVTALEDSPSRLALAAALLDCGALAQAQGRPEAARTALRRSAELARECGAEPVVARAEEHLAQLAPDPREMRGPAPHGLTRQEHRVALMAKHGLTNRQIAEQLCVTLRAVEFHLSGAYRKLGVKRDGLAAMLLSDSHSHSRPSLSAA